VREAQDGRGQPFALVQVEQPVLGGRFAGALRRCGASDSNELLALEFLFDGMRGSFGDPESFTWSISL